MNSLYIRLEVKDKSGVLSIISKQYPNSFEINKSRMKKLWGKDNLVDSLHSNQVFDKSIDSFNDASIKYHLYD